MVAIMSIQSDLDNHANQLNPNNDAYRAAIDNRSDQMNPNNPT